MERALKGIRNFFKKETVFTISLLLALVSMFAKPLSMEYLEYIDFRVLGILLGLMLIMSALSHIGIFDKICKKLLCTVKNIRQLAFVLVMLCFFSSMLITNDVALVAFVPFAIFSLKKAGHEDKAIFVVVMQTIAANLGSMLLPSGNPQNLYLYNLSEMSLDEFIILLMPYTVISFVMLCIMLMFCKKEPINITDIKSQNISKKYSIFIVIYSLLFTLGILTVCRILPYEIFLSVTLITVLVCDIKAYIGVDYFLLLTFVCFFIFIGNIGSIEIIKNILEYIVNDREVIAGIFASQVISNVPAALMLS